jgi:competence protein ComEC
VALRIETGGIRFLLAGDLEPGAQQAMMAAGSAAGIDVVKVPHHGSRNQSPGLTRWAAPARLALISVGAGNRYGHPAAATVESWQQAGAAVLRTDQAGAIAVVAGDAGSITVVPRRGATGAP